MTATTKRTFCRVCEPACGLIATVQNDQLIDLKPDKLHPVSKGFVCNKGIYGKEIHNDPDRLNVPLKRQPDGTFAPISWQQALDGISADLQRIVKRNGRGAVASYTGNPTAFNTLFGPSFGRFMVQLGARHFFSSGTQDCANKFAASQAVFGTRTFHPIPDIENADVILLIGENPAVSHMSFMSIANPMGHLRAAADRGAQIVYVNPRRIESVSGTARVVQIKPDTDPYLLAAMLEHLLSNRTLPAAVDTHGRNLGALRDFVSNYPAERVADVVGVDAQAIRALADTFADAPRAAVHASTGINMGRQGTLAYWLVQMLSFVTGNLGRAGGNYFGQGFYSRSPSAGAHLPEDYLNTPFGRIRKPGGVGISLPGNLLADYLLADSIPAPTRTDGTAPVDDDRASYNTPIRALFVNSGNPVLSIAGEQRTREALEQLELVVCVDIYRNATAEYAHYLLPAAGAFEREDINITGLGLQHSPSVQFTEAVVPPAFERRPEWWIYERLCQAMGFDSAFDDSDTPNMWARVDAMLRSRGNSFTDLKRSGLLELDRADPADLFEHHLPDSERGIDCRPESFDDAIERMSRLFDELAGEHPDQLKLITRRTPYMFNSWYENVEKLHRNADARNPLFMNPEDAHARQLEDGQRIQVRNHHGAIETTLSLSDDLRRGVVAMAHGGGQSSSHGLKVARAANSSNCNALLPSGPDSFEPISNQAHMTGIPVDVTAAA